MLNFILKYWRKLKLTIKRVGFWLLISNPIVRWSRVPLVTTGVPAITAAYLTGREFFGSKAFFAMFPNLHDKLTLLLVSATIVVALLKGCADSYLKRHEGGYIELLHSFIRMSANIVHIKDIRFKEAAKALQRGDSIFEKITHPTNQINAILNEAGNFLNKAFGIESASEVRITILQQASPCSDEWFYAFDTHEEWSQTDPKILMQGNSAARDCLQTGEPRFHPDKALAASNGQYLMSDRDKRFGNGSVYCYPVFVEVDGCRSASVITLITYGNHRLCGGYNDREIKRVGIVFREVCRRLELELTLKAVKDWNTTADQGHAHG